MQVHPGPRPVPGAGSAQAGVSYSNPMSWNDIPVSLRTFRVAEVAVRGADVHDANLSWVARRPRTGD